MDVHCGAEASILERRLASLCMQHNLTRKGEVQEHEGTAELSCRSHKMLLKGAELRLPSPAVAIGMSICVAVSLLGFTMHW